MVSRRGHAYVHVDSQFLDNHRNSFCRTPNTGLLYLEVRDIHLGVEAEDADMVSKENICMSQWCAN